MITVGKVKLMTLTQRLSARGNAYMTGILGNATVIAFPGDPNDYGETWDVFVQERTEKPATAHGSAAGASHSREREEGQCATSSGHSEAF